MSSYFSFYQTDPRMPCQIDGETDINSPNVQVVDGTERIFTQTSIQILDLVRENIPKATQNFPNNYKKLTRTKDIKIRGIVYLQNFQALRPKLRNKFKGPYRVFKQLKNDRWDLKQLSKGKSIIAHDNNIKVTKQSQQISKRKYTEQTNNQNNKNTQKTNQIIQSSY